MRHLFKQVLLIIILILLLSGLILCAAEWTLRRLDIGDSHALLVSAPGAVQCVLQVNPLFYARFFPRENEGDMRSAPYWGFAIPERKGAQAYRVVFLGGSVALGHVPDQAFNASRIFERMLAESFPGQAFEVYNFGCFALNSHVMRRAAGELKALAPDLYVVYMGNNEYIGPFGPSRPAYSPPPSSVWIQRQLSVQELRLTQFLGHFGGEDAYRMPESPAAFFEQSLKQRHDAPSRLAMYDNFAANLEAICDSAREADADVALCTVGNNIRQWPPYASLHRPDLTEEEQRAWRERYEGGLTQLRQALHGDTAAFHGALASFQEAAAVDASHADLQYRLGQCLWALQEYDAARDAYTLARDYDGFPFRADSFINERVRGVAARRCQDRVMLAEVERGFMAACEQGIMDGSLFFDAMHVLFEGNYIMASEIFKTISPMIAERLGKGPPESIPSLAQCKSWLGMSPWLEAKHLRVSLEQLNRYVGFLYDGDEVNLAPLSERLQELESRLTETSSEEALQALDAALLRMSGDFLVQRVKVEVLQELGRQEEALALARALMAQYPERPDAQLLYRRMAPVQEER